MSFLPSSQPPRRFRPRLLALAIASATGVNPAAAMDDLAEFDAAFLRPVGGGDAPHLDLQAITRGAAVTPGTYLVTLQVNQEHIDRRELRIDEVGPGQLRPCLSAALLTEVGVKLDGYAGDDTPLADCIDLAALIDGAHVDFDAAAMRVDLSVPQIAMRRNVNGYVDPRRWDDGVNAAMLNYQFAGAHSARNGQQADMHLSGGFNLGAWQLRSAGSYSYSRGQRLQDQQGNPLPGQIDRRRWQRSYTYLQRDLPGTAGRLTVGETFTPGDVFDSVPLRGVQIASDTGMLPDSMQGYAPIVRGIAETRARVEIRQNGYSLYSSYVAPGPFEINDLNAGGGRGELEVIITEADGRERRFSQPFASVANMLRENVWRYSASFGEYNPADDGDAEVTRQRPRLGQVSVARGMGRDTTLYGGVLGSGFYRAGTLGIGKSLGTLGAVSLDATHAITDRRDGGQDQGQSYRVQYGKGFASGTNLRFAGYRYSTRAFRDFGEAVRQQDPLQDDVFGTKRSQVTASVAQRMGQYGSVYVNLNQRSFWGDSRTQREAQIGASTQRRGISYGLYLSRTLSSDGRSDNSGTFTVSMPLGRTGRSATYTGNRNQNGEIGHRIAMSGRAGDERQIDYGVAVTRSDRGHTGASGNLGYRMPWAQVGASVDVSGGQTSTAVSASGSLLAHGGGMTFGHSLGDTIGLVEVPGVRGVGLNSAPNARTNGSGFVVAPYLLPYRSNRLMLDTSALPNDIDVEHGIESVVPRRGAVVKVGFQVQRSVKTLVNVRLPNGQFPPFGAHVADAEGAQAGVVGQAGQILLALQDSGMFNVRWGNNADQQCRLPVSLNPSEYAEGFRLVSATCSFDDRAAQPILSFVGETP
jgi:outer membrane usher protein